LEDRIPDSGSSKDLIFIISPKNVPEKFFFGDALVLFYFFKLRGTA
jgi:hypothetical protein